MADQRITQLTQLSKAGVAANDVLPIVDVSSSETKKVTASDLFGAGFDLIADGEIDLAKLDQASVTKLGTTALADDAVTYAKIQNVSATDKLLGRSSDGAGNIEEIPCTAQGRALLDDVDAAAQRTTLGLGSMATQSSSNVSITGGSFTGGTVSGITDLAVADGGTGASTAAGARSNLGVVIGTDVQAYDPALQSIAGLSTSGNELIYTTGTDTYAVTGLTAAGRALLDDASAADQRTTLGLGTMAVQSAGAVAITGGTAQLSSVTTSGAAITGGTITGITDLAIADGGTGASTAVDARSNLGLAIGTDVQAFDPALQSIADLTTAGDELIYTTGADTYATTPISAAARALLDDADAEELRSTLGLGTLATQSGAFSGSHSGTSSGINTGDQTITLTGDVAGTGTGTFAATIQPGSVTYAKIQDVSGTDKLLGRSSAGAGDVEEITCTAAGRALLDDATAADQRTTLGLGTLATQSGTFSGTSSGVNTGDQTIALTGDVTGSGTGTFAATISSGAVTSSKLADGSVSAAKLSGDAVTTASIAAKAVTYSRIQDVSATNRLLGRSSGGAGQIEEIACTAAGRALIDDASAEEQRTTLGLGNLATLNQVTAAEISDESITASKLANNSTVHLVAALPTTGDYTGQLALVTGTNKIYCWSGADWAAVNAAGSVNTVVADNNSTIALTVTTAGDEITLAAAPEDTAEANQFLAGPTNAGGPVTYRTITSADIPAATSSTRGAVQVNGEGLRMDGNVIEVDNDVTASLSTAQLVTYTAKGLVTGGRAIQGADLPVAALGSTGVVQPGSGLSVTNTGTLNHTNSVTPGTAAKVTYDAEGHVTGGDVLTVGDIPDLPASKLTTGTIDAARIGTNTITGEKLADSSVVQFGGAGSTSGIVTFPANPSFKGQYFFDEANGDLYLWNGNSWNPITITAGELVYAGVYSAATNTVTSVTAAGSAVGLVASAALPAASADNLRYYVIVSESGTGTSPAPAVALAPPDLLVSSGSTWDLIDVSSAVGSQLASNVSFTPYSDISSTNVQAAIQELQDEKLAKAGGTLTGELMIGTTGSLVFEGATANDFELTLAVADVTADRTITLPNQSGNLLVAGNASIVNADIATAAAIAVSKLANGTARQLLQTNAAGNSVEWASNIDIPGTLDVTGTATFDGTVNIDDGTF